MNKGKKAAVSRVFEVPFDVSSNKMHETTTALNATRDKLYVTDSSYDLPSVFVARLGLDGSADNGFGGPDGWRSEELPGSWTYPFKPAGLVPRGSDTDEGVTAGLQLENALGLVCFNGGASVQFNGKLVIGGGVEDRSSGYAREMLVVRFTDKGKVDTSFAPDGWLTFKPDIPSGGEAKVSFMRNLLIYSSTNETIYAAGDGGTNDNLTSQRGFVAEIK